MTQSKLPGPGAHSLCKRCRFALRSMTGRYCDIVEEANPESTRHLVERLLQRDLLRGGCVAHDPYPAPADAYRADDD